MLLLVFLQQNFIKKIFSLIKPFQDFGFLSPKDKSEVENEVIAIETQNIFIEFL